MLGSNHDLPAKTHTPRDPQTEERAFGYYLFNFDAGTKLENRTVTVRLSFRYLKVRHTPIPVALPGFETN
jgi:hypothetical protein